MYLLRFFVILSSQRNQMYKIYLKFDSHDRKERQRERLLRRLVDHNILMGEGKGAFLILECSASHNYSNESVELDFAQ